LPKNRIEEMIGNNIPQVAKTPHPLDLPPALPSAADLNENDQLFQLVARARSMRRRADTSSRKSLHHELTMCYHAALFIISYDGSWESFCRRKNHDAPRPRSDSKVLQAVLLEYTGDDLDGRKKASRYKRALEGLFANKTPPLVVFAQLQNDGGVDGLLKSRPGMEQVPRKTTLKSITVTDPGLYNVVLPPDARQKLVLATGDEGAEYEVKITKKIAARKRSVIRRIRAASRL
jgi:hypothetical protein